jgi:hypothetical protein
MQCFQSVSPSMNVSLSRNVAVLLIVPPTDKTKGGLLVAFYAMKVFQAVRISGGDGADDSVIPRFSSCSRAISLDSRKSQSSMPLLVSHHHPPDRPGRRGILMTDIAWAGGNVIAPQIFQSQWAPRYLNSLYIHLGFCECTLHIPRCLAAREI